MLSQPALIMLLKGREQIRRPLESVADGSADHEHLRLIYRAGLCDKQKFRPWEKGICNMNWLEGEETAFTGGFRLIGVYKKHKIPASTGPFQ